MLPIKVEKNPDTYYSNTSSLPYTEVVNTHTFLTEHEQQDETHDTVCLHYQDFRVTRHRIVLAPLMLNIRARVSHNGMWMKKIPHPRLSKNVGNEGNKMSV